MLLLLLLSFADAALSAASSTALPIDTRTGIIYNYERSSSMGFAKASGSGFSLAATTPINQSIWHLGWQTVGTGGTAGDGQFYRLATGPVAAIALSPKWHLSFSPQWCAETFDKPGIIRRTRGHGATIGWRRNANIGKKIALSWGAYLAAYSPAQSVSQGIEISATILN
jgi:hypothetical protein